MAQRHAASCHSSVRPSNLTEFCKPNLTLVLKNKIKYFPMDYKSVFVTVGTTSFDALIAVINTRECEEALKKMGCKKLVIQFGRGNNYIW